MKKPKFKKNAVIGIDFGATNLKALLIDHAGKVRQRFIEPSMIQEGPDKTLKRIARLVRRAEKEAHATGLRLTDVGLGVCAPIDQTMGRIIQSPVLPGWHNVPIKAAIERESDLPVHVDNDGNMAVLGEWWQGVAKNASVVAGLTLGTGIGGGLVIDGLVFRGGHGFGAEFGHISVAKAPDCPCGGQGCLGRLASITDTLARYQALADKRARRVRDIGDLDALIDAGDRFAKQSMLVSAEYLSRVIVILINCLNPEIFVLAGGMASLGPRLVQPIRKFVRSSTFPFVAASTRIVTAKLGVYSGCFGAARLALAESRQQGESRDGISVALPRVP